MDVRGRRAFDVSRAPTRPPTVARTLVEERLAACVNIVPAVRSIYRWEGAIHDDAEALAIIKTTARARRGDA